MIRCPLALRLLTLLVAALAAGLVACSTGEGKGWVRSDRLYVEDCWNGPFDLKPTFFAANPFREEELLIRIQRGDNIQELSDGLTVHVSDIVRIREELLGQAIEAGLPPGVTPPGTPVVADPDPPLVSLALYLHNTCHADNGTVYAVQADQVAGASASTSTITFTSLFSGDPNESNADDRLTEATFEALFADPRDLESDGVPADKSSVVTGSFHFFFQRGPPAQPFP
jgi:hypothetical protein